MPNIAATTNHYKRILRFMMLAKQNCPSIPAVPDEKVRTLRARLILEEALETINALGVEVQIRAHDCVVTMENAAFHAVYPPNLTEIVDGCADLSVVTIGTLIACGVRDQQVLDMVDENNLAKFGPGHSLRADGKLIKPPDHKKPNFLQELHRQGYQG